MSEPLTDLINEIWHNGIQFVTVVSVLIYAGNEFRKYKLDKRDEAMFHNIKIIMEELGRGEWFAENPNSKRNMERQLLNFGLTAISHALPVKLSIRRKVIKQLILSRRKKKMNSNINFLTLIPTLAMALKLILQVFGIQIPDENVNAVVNVISSVGAVIGVYLPHTKAAAISETVVQALPDIQNTIHKVIADPNTSYAKMVPVINEVHKTLTTLFEDMQTGKVTDATREAMSAYLTFQAYLQTIKPTPPISEPIVIPSAEKVGA